MDGTNTGADPVALAARVDTKRTCPRCGTVFDMPDRGRGRRPVWCSPACRRLASAERVAARNAGSAVTVVEVPRSHRPDPDARLAIPSMGTLARLFLSSPVLCRQLLDTLVHRYSHDTLHAELRADMEAFAASIHQQQNLAADPEYRRAMEDVTRLRRHLQMEADRAEDRRRELATLRAELLTKTTLITRLRAELANLSVPALETTSGHDFGGPRDAVRGGDPGSGMSRQQRRAAARAAHKNE